MPGYDPRFWELPFDPGDLEDLPEVWSVPAEVERSPSAARARAEVLSELARLVHSSLTENQRRIVQLHFYEGKTQVEIAEQLGISQQAVSRQLFGVIRNGRRIGGAVNRLRKIAKERGWDPAEWV